MEGDPLLLVAAAGGEYGAAPGGGAAADLGEQGGLADTGAARDGEQGATGTSVRLDAVRAQPGEFRQRLVNRGFTLPLQESPSAPRTALHHGAPPSRRWTRAGSERTP
ncbi:hypothetical protein AB0D34_02580 [Streptomyces sp. NPDC048420]|uniref:hypothetical protein n=1 Tax=Streptomyces sp. NPDC048420 TaxID=3155755 RepID=UPI00341F51E1